MAKKTENRGGNRKGAGAKKKTDGTKKVPISFTCYAEEMKVKKHGKAAVKEIGRYDAQKAIDKL